MPKEAGKDEKQQKDLYICVNESSRPIPESRRRPGFVQGVPLRAGGGIDPDIGPPQAPSGLGINF